MQLTFLEGLGEEGDVRKVVGAGVIQAMPYAAHWRCWLRWVWWCLEWMLSNVPLLVTRTVLVHGVRISAYWRFRFACPEVGQLTVDISVQ